MDKFVLLLWKRFYLYEYADGWEKFNEWSLTEKEYFHSHLNMKDLTDVYLGLSVLEFNKIVMHDSWHNYVKLKYGENARLCVSITDSFIVS